MSRIDAMLARYVAPGMRVLGFRRQGRVYRLGDKGADQVVIWTQWSSSAQPLCQTFYLWCGVLPRVREEFRGRGHVAGRVVRPDPPVEDALFATRIEAPDDVAFSWAKVGQIDSRPIRSQWFFVPDAESERACGEALVATVEGYMPMFHRVRDPRAALELYELTRYQTIPFLAPGHPNTVLRAVLLSDSGPSPERDDALHELRTAGKADIAEWIEARIEAST